MKTKQNSVLNIRESGWERERETMIGSPLHGPLPGLGIERVAQVFVIQESYLQPFILWVDTLITKHAS